MPTLSIRLSDFDKKMLDSLAKSTGQTKTALVLRAIRHLNSDLREERGITQLSPEDFDGFLQRVFTPETNVEVLESRKRLLSMRPVWEK